MEVQDEGLQSEMQKAIEKAKESERADNFKAAQQLVASPEDEDLITRNNQNLDEDDPTVHQAFRAATRNTEPSVTLICLHRFGKGVTLDPEGASPLDISHKPGKEVVKQLLRQSRSVQKREVVDYFTNHKSELSWKGWKEVAALKFAYPVIFENGKYHLANTKYALVLDRCTGLTIQKEEE